MRRPERRHAMKEFIVWFIRSWFWAMKRSNQLINSLKTAFVWERRHSSVGSERLICNSKRAFCAVFQDVAQRVFQS
jgi:hypothetical protein